MRRRLSLVLPFSIAVAALATLPLSAQQYSGTFTVPNNEGGVMTLVLREGGNGNITGKLTSNGVSYRVEGSVEDGMVVGVMRSDEGTLFFEAERWDDELMVTLYGTDAQGQPNYEDYTEIDFAAQQAAGRNPLTTRAPVTGGNPLAGGRSDPYVGTFSDGNVTLELRGGGGQYEGQVTVDGAVYPVQARGDANGIQGLIQTPDGSFEMAAQAQDGGLFVVSGGAQYNLMRQGAGNRGSARVGGARQGGAAGAGAPGVPPNSGSAPGRTSTGRELAPGFTEDHPQVREWVAFLAGNKLTRMSSYSSGSAGGYSARTDIYLCSDRSFAMHDESLVAVDVGGAFGNSGSADNSQGRWYVITNGQVVGLVLEFSNGQAQEFRMEYQNQETYANGERVYVTAAGVCR